MPNVQPIIYTINIFKNINQKVNRRLLPKDTGYSAQNLRYDTELASIAKRLSRAKYNSTTIGASPILGMHRYYKNSLNSATLIVNYSGQLMVGYDNAGVFSAIKTGLNATNFATFQTFKDLEFIFNGTNTNMVFTRSTATTAVEDMGVPSSIRLPSATLSLTTGNLSGTYYYAYSQQFDGYQEGNAGPSTTGLLATCSRTTIVIPTSTNTRATGFYLYRTKSNSSILYRLAALSGNSVASTYSDNTADTSLDTTIIAPTDYGIPAIYKYVCLHKGRLFLAGNLTNKSDIPYSDVRNNTSYPDVFPVNNILYVARDDGDEITAILNDNFGQFIIFKKNSVRILNTTADSDTTWDLSDSLSTEGCIAPYSAVTTPWGIMYLTRYGEQKKRLVMWTGSKISIIPELEGLEPILTSIPETAMEQLRGHYHNGYYYFAYHTSGEYNDKVLVINLLNWSWEIDTKNVAAFCSWSGGSDFGELYTATSDNTGFIYREDTTAYDLLITKKSEFDQGTFSQTQSLGAETTPSIGLTNAVSTNIGARTWANMISATDTWANFVSYKDTWWLSGEWLDTVRDISAKALLSLYWNEVNPANTEVWFFVRTGNTLATCQTATWNGPYTTPASSDISGVSAAKYIQIKAQLFAKTYSDYDKPLVYRSGTSDDSYAIRVSANYGNAAEATIEFDWQSGRFDLGDINEVYKRLRKRLRSIKIEYEIDSTSTGSLDFMYYLDGNTTARETINSSYSAYPSSRIYNFPLNTFCEDFSYRLYSNSDNKSLTIRKLEFTVSTEPYFSKK